MTEAYDRSSKANQQVAHSSNLLLSVGQRRREVEALQRQAGGIAGVGGPQLSALRLQMASLPDLTPTINQVSWRCCPPPPPYWPF